MNIKKIKKYSVTLFDTKESENGYQTDRYQIAWRPNETTSHALLCENPNHIRLIPTILREAGYIESSKTVF